MKKNQGRGLVLELLAILLIGSGVVRLIAPREHVRRWACGPWRDLVLQFEDRPMLMRVTGVIRVLLGVCLVPRIPAPKRWWPF